MTAADRSNGWEAVASTFIPEARTSTIGVATVDAWARTLPPGASILDLGCGAGSPRSAVLVDRGFGVHAIDASPSLVDAYRIRFPQARLACEPIEESSFFGETFDGALAWGVIFLLSEETQRIVIDRVAGAIRPGGRFLFTAPHQQCTWSDLLTGRPSLSLGAHAYRSILSGAGFALVAEFDDEGENHYYEAVRP